MTKEMQHDSAYYSTDCGAVEQGNDTGWIFATAQHIQ